jgi:endonuclease/exonuclease/phosphatase family metal-dependent hydrolase
MRRRVADGVRAFTTGLIVLAAFSALPSSATAQTTLVLDAPRTEVNDTVVRGGAYASRNYEGQVLITRDSTSLDYVRRVLLKFDTYTRLPINTRIQSATLRLTVKKGSVKRPIAVYHVAQSFDAARVTWMERKNNIEWKVAGGFYGRKYAENSQAVKPGSKIVFDVTKLVQDTVNRKFDSRYTRIALIDDGAPAFESYREYYSSEAEDPDDRPSLTVVYGTTPAPPRPSTPNPPPPDDDEDDDRDGSATLRVLQWNTHHGRGTDGEYDIERIATWIAKMKADLVSLNEIHRFADAYGDEDQAARYAAMLRAKTGKPWYYAYLSAYDGLNGGNAILSRYPITGRSECVLSSTNRALHVSVVVNGRTVNFWTTHLPSGKSSSPRVNQSSDVLNCARQFSQIRIIAGDWNSTQQRTEYTQMLENYEDAWAVARKSGDAVDFPKNSRPGATHDWRIDYVFYSKSASRLRLQKAQVFDTRGANGARPSDHKPLLVTFIVD